MQPGPVPVVLIGEETQEFLPRQIVDFVDREHCSEIIEHPLVPRPIGAGYLQDPIARLRGQ